MALSLDMVILLGAVLLARKKEQILFRSTTQMYYCTSNSQSRMRPSLCNVTSVVCFTTAVFCESPSRVAIVIVDANKIDFDWTTIGTLR